MRWILIVVTVYSQSVTSDQLNVQIAAEGAGWYATAADCRAWVDGNPTGVVSGRTDMRVCVPVMPDRLN